MSFLLLFFFPAVKLQFLLSTYAALFPMHVMLVIKKASATGGRREGGAHAVEQMLPVKSAITFDLPEKLKENEQEILFSSCFGAGTIFDCMMMWFYLCTR